MRIKLGDNIQLNRNIGRFKKGDTFTIDDIYEDIVYGVCHKTGQRIVLFKNTASYNIIDRVGLYVY